MKYYIKKILTLIITLFAVSLLAFWAFHVIPGDVATDMLGTEATPEKLEALREQLGLNRPFFVQYFDWLRDFLFGDMGTSYSYSMSVKELVMPKLPITVALTVMSFLVIVVISVPLGVWQGKHAGELTDAAVGVLGQVIMSFPPFFLGMVFTLVFGLMLKITGLIKPSQIVARVVSATVNFVVNKKVVYQSKGNWLRELIRYALLALGNLVVSLLILEPLSNAMGGHVHLAYILVQVIMYILNFFIQGRFVYKRGSVKND